MLIYIFSILIIFITHATLSSDSQIDTKEDDRLRNNCIAFGDICYFEQNIPCCDPSNDCRTVKWRPDRTRSVCITPALIGEYCRYDTDCLRLDYARCNTDYQECDCLPNYGALTNNSKCVALIGGYCDEYKSCVVDNSICIDNQCQCRDPFIMKSNTECLLTSIGEPCEGDIDCNDVLHIGCSVNKKCVCKDNHILVNNLRCVPFLNEFCWSNERCAPNNSICLNNRCKCKPDYIAISNTHCSDSYIGRPCASNQDCKKILHSVCSEHGVCICDTNYAVINRDKCVPLIGGVCFSDKECRIENSFCVDNKCQCSSNYSSLNDNKCILVEK